MHRLWIGTLAALTLTGCAGMTVKRLETNDTTTEGVRFARPWPYLAVTADADKFDVKLVWLPDLEEQYAVQWSAGLFGSANPDITLQDGWMLTAISGEVQSGGSTIKDLFTTLLSKGDAEISGKDFTLEPGLYRMVPKSDAGHTQWSLERVTP